MATTHSLSPVCACLSVLFGGMFESAEDLTGVGGLVGRPDSHAGRWWLLPQHISGNTGCCENRNNGRIGIDMSAIKLYHEPLLTAAAEGALILTANKRFARHLVRLYDERMQSEGRQAWQCPAIHSAEARRHVLSTLDQGWRVLALVAAQRHMEEVVKPAWPNTDSAYCRFPPVLPGLRKPGTAGRIPGGLLYRPMTDDHRAFLRWRDRFQAACAAGDWLDPAESADFVVDAPGDAACISANFCWSATMNCLLRYSGYHGR
jgi:hypothetical protein